MRYNDEYVYDLSYKNDPILEKKAKEAFLKVFDFKNEASLNGWTRPIDDFVAYAEKIVKKAEKIRSICDMMVVIGVGGSYLGSKAAIDFLIDQKSGKDVKVCFAGTSLDSDGINELLCECEGKELCINVVSKSGTTLESNVVFDIFEDYMINRYGENAKDRIFATTGKSGLLRDYATEKGYEIFDVPENVGGRYSVLTTVGLLPIAVSGIDIVKILKGAKQAYDKYKVFDLEKNDCVKYAIIRNALLSKGKSIEIFEFYSCFCSFFGGWLKQLFGESEGKCGTGIYPSSLIFPADLHSIGQYLQDGTRNFFQTVIYFKNSQSPIVVPTLKKKSYFAGETLDYIQMQTFRGVLKAHYEGGISTNVFEFDERNEEAFGYLVYFFELSCAVSAYILGVDPFDQPGVETYKRNVKMLLK